MLAKRFQYPENKEGSSAPALVINDGKNSHTQSQKGKETQTRKEPAVAGLRFISFSGLEKESENVFQKKKKEVKMRKYCHNQIRKLL